MAGCLAALLFGLATLSVVSALASGTVSSCTEAEFTNAIAGGGLVTFSSDCNLTLTKTIPVKADTIIDSGGHSVTISGGSSVRLFTVSADLQLAGLALINGKSPAGSALFINTNGSVTATNCTFAGNNALGTNGTAGVDGSDSSSGTGGKGQDGTSGLSGLGGAICNRGAVNLLNCTFATNAAAGGNGGTGGNGGDGGGSLGQGGDGGSGGAGAVGYGGAIYNLGTLLLTNCSLINNRAGGGSGGAGGTSGSATFAGLTGSGGAGAPGAGGGVFNGESCVIVGCTFSGNSAQGGSSAAGGNRSNGIGAPGAAGGSAQGGGLYNGLSAALTNCTFFSNVVVGANGGNGGNGSGTLPTGGNGGNGGDANGGSLVNLGSMSVVNCTLSTGNALGGTNGVAGSGTFAGSSGNPGRAQGGDIAGISGTVTLMNSILAAAASGGNSFGAITDNGHNISSDLSLSLTGTSHSNTDPKLGALMNNGGPTLTMALLSGSLALNAIDPATGSFPPTDQRGVARPAGDKADIGAYEAGIPNAFPIHQPTFSTNRLSIVYPSQLNFSYVLQFKTQLTNTSWTALSTNLGTGGLITNQDFTTNQPSRFYRVLVR